MMVVCIFYFHFCDIAEVAIIHNTEFESRKKRETFTFLATVLEPDREIWWFFQKRYISRNLATTYYKKHIFIYFGEKESNQLNLAWKTSA